MLFIRLYELASVVFIVVGNVRNAISGDLSLDSSVFNVEVLSAVSLWRLLGLYFLIRTGCYILKLFPLFAACMTTELTYHLPEANETWSFC